MTELKPCPFCGSDEIDPRSGGSPECCNCGAKPGNSLWSDRWCDCPEPAVTVKPLEWDIEEGDKGDALADSPLGPFNVYYDEGHGWLAERDGHDDTWVKYPSHDYGFDTREDGVKCCEEYYTGQMASFLITTPATDVRAGALRAAAEIARQMCPVVGPDGPMDREHEAAYETAGSIMTAILALIDQPAPEPAVTVKPETPGPYEARIVPSGMPTDCCKYGVISLTTGLEVCRVWKEQDARAITDALTSAQEVQRGALERAANEAEGYYLIDGSDVIAEAILALIDQPAPEPVTVQQAARVDLLQILDDECWDLRCVASPNLDDADIVWKVVSHDMEPPNERIEGCGHTPKAALANALRALAGGESQ